MARINFISSLLLSASLCVALPFVFVHGDQPAVDAVPFRKNSAGIKDPLVKVPSGAPARTFQVMEFTKLELHSVLHTVVRKAGTSSIVAYGPQELVDAVVVKEKNGRVSIDLDTQKEMEINEPVVLVIGSPALDEVNLSGAAIAVLENMEAKGFIFGASGASHAQMDLQCKDLRLDLSGGSELELIGSAAVLSANVSGASELQAEGFATGNATVGASGASQILVHCTGMLTIDASGASAVDYSGDPTEVKENSSGMAVVNKRGSGR